MIVLPPQLAQLIAFGCTQPRQHVRPPARFLVGLHDPVAERLRYRLKLLGKIVWVAPSTDQIDHLATEFRLIRNTAFRHDDAFRKSLRGSTNPG